MDTARFDAWWRGELTDLPLMWVEAREETPPLPPPSTPAAQYLDAGDIARRFLREAEGRQYLGDAFPVCSADLGPGSLALYLGAEPDFRRDTVWFRPAMADIRTPLDPDDGNVWWQTHMDIYRTLKAALGGRARLAIPDLVEGIDILAALRDPQTLLYDIMDNPEAVSDRIREIEAAYFLYYDTLYDLTREEDGSSAYTCFRVKGSGRVAKVQCDLSAMLSPRQFRRFVLPCLDAQTRRLDHSLYHLDGPDALRHLDAVMELPRLEALQWTAGAGQKQGADPCWFPVYDKVADAGKSMWVDVSQGGVEDWIAAGDTFLQRYGGDRVYLLFPTMTPSQAERLLRYADETWRF